MTAMDVETPPKGVVSKEVELVLQRAALLQMVQDVMDAVVRAACAVKTTTAAQHSGTISA